jgi:uncharacterized repeat protein (TIGR01451 family)
MRSFSRVLSLTVLLALLLSLAGANRPAASAAPALAALPGLQIKLDRATFEPALGEPALAPALRLPAASAATNSYFLVQFSGPPTAADRLALTKRGAEIVDYVPDYAYVVRLRDAAALDRAALGLNYVGAIQPAYKLARSLDNQAALPRAATGAVLLTLTSWPGESAATVARAVRGLGGDVLASADNPLGSVLQVAIDPARINDLAFVNAVAWIEPTVKMELHNDVGRAIMGVPAAQTGLGLHGEGQIVAVADSGLDSGDLATMHPDLRGRVLAGYAWGRPTDPDFPGDPAGDWSDNEGHGTHVAGSVTGDGTMSGANPATNAYAGSQAGSAPKAQLVFQSIGDSNNGLSGLPSDLNLLFQQAYDAGARIHTNSWGSAVAGAYTGDARQVDQFLWSHPDMYIAFSAGNEGSDEDGTLGVIDPGSLGSPATAKNAASVGASESERASGGFNPGSLDCSTYGNCFGYPANPIKNDTPSNNRNGMAAFSSRGPTADGRLKPDFVAPGTNILSTHSQQPAAGLGWGEGPSQWYNYEGGTSMSTPLSAGAAVLVRQFYTDVENVTAPSGALIKATLINGAADMSPGQYNASGAFQEILRRPDRSQGWGRVDVANAIMPAGPGGLWYDDHNAGLSTGQTITYTSVFTVGADASAPFRATLAWADYPGSLIALTKLVNDLDLQVIGPDSTVYYGNDRADGLLDNDIDRLNNIEGIDIPNPLPGAYTLVVRAHNIPQGSQPYALVVAGPQGGVSLNPPLPSSQAIAGRTVQYGLTVRNSTSSARAFDIALANAPAWPTTLSAGSTGTLAVGATTIITASVAIPSSATPNSSATATVRVQAAGTPSISDTATLTTYAVGESVLLSPASQRKSGPGGSEVSYLFTLTNRTGSARSFNLAVSGNQWPSEVRDTLGAPISSTSALAPDASAEVVVAVTLPANSLIGKRDLASLNVVASDSPPISAQASLTTTAAVGWQQGDDLLSAVGEATLISAGGKLHLLGGVGSTFTPSAAHRIYDPATGIWSNGVALPGPLYSADGCAIGGKLYIPGGRSSTLVYDGALRVFDLGSATWSALPSVTTASGTKQPIRYKAICDPAFGTQGAVYLIGGADRNASLAALSGVYRFDIAAGSWQARASLGSARTNPFAGLIAGSIYVAGGQSDAPYSTALASAEVYNPGSNSWGSQPSMPVATTAGGAAVASGELYAFGGRKLIGPGVTETTGDAYRFDPVAGTWAGLPPLNVARLLIAGAAQDGVIYAIGGNVTGDPTVEYYTVGGGATLAVSASASAPALVNRGDTFSTTITVTATGTTGAASATLTDTLPLALDYAGGLTASAGTIGYSAASRTISWSGPLTTSSPLVIGYSSTVRNDVPLGQSFTNRAYVNDGENRADSLVVASATSRVNGPSLGYSSQRVEPQSAGYGTTVTYTLNMVNNGSTSANASLVDPLPAGLTFGAFVDSDGGKATYDALNRRVLWSATLSATSQLEYSLEPTAYSWAEISASGSVVAPEAWAANGTYPADDEGYATIALPWAVPFYGEKFSTIFIDANGQVGFSRFDAPTSDFFSNVDTAIPAPGYPNHRVALRYTDLNLGAIGTGGGQVYTYHDSVNQRFIVEFKDAKSFSNADAGTSQLIIEPSGRMRLQYLRVGNALFAGEIGFENRAGTAGLYVANLPADGSAFEILPALYATPEVVFTATVNGSAPIAGTLANVAQLSDGVGTTSLLTATLTLSGVDAAIKKTASVTAAALDDEVTYTITARNAAAYPGLVSVADPLPAGLEYVPGSASGGAQFNSGANRLEWAGELGTASYAKTSTVDAAAFTDISATGTPTGLGDEDNELLDLPFPVLYYGDTYTKTALVANGYLFMYQGTPPSKYVYPNNSPLGTANPDNIIAPFWADLDPTPTQLTPAVEPTIFYQTLGAAPNRRFIVQWQKTPLYGAPAAQGNTFQVVLHESDGRIQFIYKTMSNLGAAATIGIEDRTGVRSSQHSFATNSIGNGTVLTWTPTNSEAHTFTFRATVVAPAAVGSALVNTATVQFGAQSRQSSASVLVSESSQNAFKLYLPLIKR